MNRQQEFLFGLVKEIRDICDANGIQYFLGFGTLLGAVRNGGFLPWDDDADVIMTHENFLRFVDACKTDLPPNRYLGYAAEDETYGHLLPRYISTDTTAIHTAQSLGNCVAGELIDIFVLDPIADGRDAYDTYLKDLGLYTTAVNYANAAAFKLGTSAEDYDQCLEIQKSQGTKAMRKMVSERLLSNHSDKGRYYALRWQGAPILLERSCFESAVPIEFEGETFSAPVDRHGFFKTFYGEEWMDVPSNINPSKHTTAASLDFGYEEALEYYKSSVDCDELLHKTEERRKFVLTHAAENNRLRDEAAVARGEMIARDVAALIDEHRSQFNQALATRDGATLSAILDFYSAWQTSADAIGRCTTKGFYRRHNPVIAPVDEDVYAGLLLSLIHKGRINHARLLVELRRQVGLPLTGVMLQVEKATCDYNKAIEHLQFNRDAEALELTRHLCVEYPDSARLLTLLCYCEKRMYEKTQDVATFEAFKQHVSDGMSAYPADGVFLKFQGDIKRLSGDNEGARHLYLQAAEMTRNGLALQDIAVRTGYYPKWLREPDWAKAAGVPQWKGIGPIARNEKKSLAELPPIEDPRKRLLVDLLKEIVQECNKAKIGYFLGPSLTRGFTSEMALPGVVDDYSIVCGSADVQHLYESLKSACSANREMGKLSENGFCYASSGSLYCNLDRPPVAGEPWGLRINILTELGLSTLINKRKGKSRGSLESLRLIDSDKKACAGRLRDIATEWGTFCIPASVDEYLEVTLQQPVSRTVCLGEYELCCSQASLESFIGEGLFDSAWFEYRRAARSRAQFEKEILKEFRRHYQQIRLAVALKQLSLEILPKKEAILALDKAGNYKQLDKEMRPLLALEKRYRKYGNVDFDPDLYAILQKTRKRGAAEKHSVKTGWRDMLMKRARRFVKRFLGR